MASEGFKNIAMDKTEESMLIEEADQSMANPNLVNFVVGDTTGKRGCALTIRVWLVGLLLTVMFSVLSQVLVMRTLPVMIHPLISLILAYPLGNFCANSLPKKVIRFKGMEVDLNPGPFSLREHALVMLMTSSSNVISLGLMAEIARELFFQQTRSKVTGVLSGLAPLLIGIGMGGLASRVVVLPSEMVWPQALMSVSLTKALHERRYFPSASRIKFFWMISIGAFSYQFLPGFLFSALSSLSFLCWMNPSSITVSQLGSGLRGLGMGAISLDWSLIVSYIPSPLVYPFYAAANLFAGFVIFMWILVPWGYYSNVLDSQQMPIQSFNLYDINGMPYRTDQIHTNGILKEAAYNEAGPLRMSWLFFLSYFFSLAAASSAVTHVALYHGPELMTHAKAWIASISNRRKQAVTINSDVPSLWYAGITLVGLLLGVISIYLSEARLSIGWYTILTGVILGFIFIIPITWIMGMTSHGVNTSVFIEMVSGILWPGNGAAMIYFRVYSYFTVFMASDFCMNLKYGQYMKLPPRQVLLVKLVGTILVGIIQPSVAYFLFDTIPTMCDPKNPMWACTYYNAFRSSVLIWGTVGPTRLFSKFSIYHPIAYAILAGFFLPLPFYALHRRSPSTLLAYINIPIILSGVSFAPAAPSVQFITWFLLAFLFNHVVYTRFQSWWLRKNLLLSAGLDTGTFLATFILAIVLSMSDFRPQWWGNDPQGGCPLAGMPLNPTDAAKAFLAKMAQQSPK